MSQLRIEDLRYHIYGPIDLTIGSSECVSLTGPSGSGKTLLLRALADLDEHEGKIFLDDEECHEFEAPQWRKNVAMLPSESQWWFDRVGEHFDEPEERWLAMMDFDKDVMTWQVSRLSTGEKARLALLRLLENHPKALLLDEPTANLDAKSVDKFEMLVEEYRAENAAPVLWVNHDNEQSQRIAGRRFEIKNGTIIETE